MKKSTGLICIILCLVMCAGLMVGCGSAAKPETSSAPAAENTAEATEATEPIVITLGHIYSTSHNEAVALQNLADNIAKATDGKVTMTIYPSSQMGSEREMAEMVAMGTLDMGLSDGPTWSNALNVPELAVFGLPFLYNSISGEAACFPTILDAAKTMMEGTGVVPLFCTSASIRGAMMATKPIASLKDISDVKMRVPEITMYVNTWKNLGANATTTAWSECYQSISQGVVDGCEADPSTLVDANLQEVTKYFSKTNHMGTIHIISINEAKWNSIPADLQAIILEECEKISAEQVEARKVADSEALAKMEASGIVINDIPDDERAKMVEAEQPLYDEYSSQYGLGDLIAQLQEAGAISD